MGPDGPDKHRKGKNRISAEMASFINDEYSLDGLTKVIDTTSDLLCTACFHFETSRMDSVVSSHKMDTSEVTRPTVRTAAILASARISDQSGIERMVFDQQERDSSSDDMDDETSHMETAERREQTISLLNGVFDLFSLKRINDTRNQNILRDQTNKVTVTIHRLVKQLLPGNDAEALQESLAFDYTLNEAEELIQGLKQLVGCSDYAEQIRLLTLAPRSWGRAKVEAFFNCSERQARYGVHLREYGRILHRPVDLRGNLPFDPQIEKKIFEFYHDDLISRVRLKPPSVFCSN
jgi:hypothetical protein